MNDAIVVPSTELDLEMVLMSGQTFRWRRDDSGWWISPIGEDGTVFRTARIGDELKFETRGGPARAMAEAYFRLDISLTDLRNKWASAGESELIDAIDAAPGLRLVRQDPVECLFSFLCSSAAPIHRIRRSVDGMCRLLGEDLGIWHGVQLNSFPTLEALAAVPRVELDRLGLGFRGRYINAAARMILERGGKNWLTGLRSTGYEDAKSGLVTLPGVGEKVADCVCLFSLDKDEAVPIDVHMARVARRQFETCGSSASVTPKTYGIFAGCFRERYGTFAGWAQQYFFYAEIERRGIWDQDLGRHRPKPASPLK